VSGRFPEAPRKVSSGLGSNQELLVKTCQSIGTIETAIGPRTLTRAGAVFEPNAGDGVFPGDTIETGPNGTVDLRFVDGTRFVLSSSSHVVLEDFVHGSGGSLHSALLNLAHGAFAFIVGRIARSDGLTINTPLASITSLVWPLSAQAQSEGASPAVAAAPVTAIGRVVSAAGSVTIEHVSAVVVQASTGQAADVKVGDPVYLGDVVQTGADGRLGVAFTDGTAFTLSSSARMVLNEFVYDPNGKSNSTLFSLTKGTFTFVAGKVAKTGDMKIDTPVATMGIRGTTPHVEISEDGSVRFSTLIEEGKDSANAKVRHTERGK
jgi:hypothetical protein